VKGDFHSLSRFLGALFPAIMRDRQWEGRGKIPPPDPHRQHLAIPTKFTIFTIKIKQ